MIDWIFKHKADFFLYILFSPVLLIFIIPFTSFYGDLEIIFIPFLFIFWLQVLLYYSCSLLLVSRLIALDKSSYMKISKRVFTLFSLILVAIISTEFILLFNDTWKMEALNSQIFTGTLVVSEVCRAAALSHAIVCLEQKTKVSIFRKLTTFYIVINPLLGWWSLHSRVRLLLKD